MATATHTDTATYLDVFTSPQTAPAGFETIAATRRETAGKTLADHERMRCIIIRELEVRDVPNKYQGTILDALRRTAREQLDAIWKDDPLVRMVPTAIWTVDSLLAFADRQVDSTRLTKDALAEWFNASQLHAALAAGADAKKQANWEKAILSLAAPTIDRNADQCAVIISAIRKYQHDAESTVGRQLIAKLQRRIDALRKTAEELDAL